MLLGPRICLTSWPLQGWLAPRCPSALPLADTIILDPCAKPLPVPRVHCCMGCSPASRLRHITSALCLTIDTPSFPIAPLPPRWRASPELLYMQMVEYKEGMSSQTQSVVPEIPSRNAIFSLKKAMLPLLLA